jgi:glucose-specific phosphotransferase system IIA component
MAVADKSALGEDLPATDGSRPRPAGEVLLSPVSGMVMRMSDVDDPVFSSGMLGKGAAVEPSSGVVCSPADGTVSVVARAKHALCMTTKTGLEVLVHVGIDSVGLGGAPFDLLCDEGQVVRGGQPLMRTDLDAIRGAGVPATVMVVVMSTDDTSKVEGHLGPVAQGEELLRVI